MTSARCNSSPIHMSEFILTFTKNKMYIGNPQNKRITEVSVKFFGDSARPQSLYITDLVGLEECLKKITCVYVGKYTKPIASFESILGIDLEVPSLITKGNFVCINAKKLGPTAAAGAVFLRNCPNHALVTASHINIDRYTHHFDLKPICSLTHYIYIPKNETALSQQKISYFSSNKATYSGATSCSFNGAKVILEGKSFF